MRRYLVWLVSAAFALAVFGLCRLAGLPELLVLLLTFIGALAGAVAGTTFTQGRFGAGQEEPPQRPPRRGSGR